MNTTPHFSVERSRLDVECSRRAFLGRSPSLLGTAAFGKLLAGEPPVSPVSPVSGAAGAPGLPHFALKVKRVIYLFMAGGPSHIDLFDYKPVLLDLNASVLHGLGIDHENLSVNHQGLDVRLTGVDGASVIPGLLH